MRNKPHFALDFCSILARSYRLLTLAAFGVLSTLAPAATPDQQAEAVLLPFLDLLTSPPANEARACRLVCRVESLGDVQFADGTFPTFELALQPPGRLLLKLRTGATLLAACRDGQKAWVAPGTSLPPRDDNAAKKELQFPPMQLPFSGKQLAILPVLLEVQDKGTAPLDGATCRVLDVRTRPEIARLLPPEASGWSVRLWLNPEGRPLRAGVRLPKQSLVLRVDTMDFSKELPSQVWAQPSGARVLEPGDFEKVVAHLLGGSK